MSRIRIVALAALCVTAAAACSSSAKHASSSPPVGGGLLSSTATRSSAAHGSSGGGCGGDVVARICASVSITGAISASGQATAPAPIPSDADPKSTCAQLATLGDGGGRDLGDTLSVVSGHNVMWDASFGSYHGPGSYGPSDTQFYVSVDEVSYNGTAGSTIAIVVQPDFSTTLTFSGLKSSDSDGTIAGTISWTCGDPS